MSEYIWQRVGGTVFYKACEDPTEFAEFYVGEVGVGSYRYLSHRALRQIDLVSTTEEEARAEAIAIHKLGIES